jgi:hypothetical protein
MSGTPVPAASSGTPSVRLNWAYTAAILVVANFVSGGLESPTASGACLIALVILLFTVRAARTSPFQALFEIVFASISFGYVVQILGEALGTWATSRTAITLLLGVVAVTTIYRSKVGHISVRAATLSTAAFIAGATGWAFALSMSHETITNFLGYGYDNAAHLAQARMIVVNHGTTLLNNGLTSVPTFIQDSSQAGTGFVATIYELTASPLGLGKGLTVVYALTTVLIPALLVLAPFFAYAGARKLRFSNLVVAISTILVLGTGYLSRIWFSGYFTSNLGTLLLGLTAIAVAVKTFHSPLVLIAAALVTAHVYPLFLLVGIAVVAIPSLQSAWDALNDPVARRERFPVPLVGMVAIVGALLVLPVRATGRSFGGSQFLVDGGIEYLPTRFLLFWGLVALVPASVYLWRRSMNPAPGVVVVASAVGAIAVCLYSLHEMHRITYYPTKLAISFAVLAVCAVSAGVQRLTSNSALRLFATFAVVAVAAYARFEPAPRVFSGAYMGTAEKVIGRVLDPKPEVVSAPIVIAFSDESETVGKTILLISSQYESELNTRWINFPTGRWTDSTWSAWMSIRASIEGGHWDAASDSLAEADIIVATDSESVFHALDDINPGVVCLIDANFDCEFSV